MGISGKNITLEVGKLPTLPTVFDQLYSMISNPDSTAREVAAVIKSDPAISARVLRLVNSAFYGFGGKIKTVQHALVILGYNTIRNLVLSISVFQIFGSEGGSPRLNKLEFWKHSILCGVIAQILSEKQRDLNANELFTAGILHDVGKLILEQHFGDEYDKAFAKESQKDVKFHEAEKQLWGISHPEVGKYLKKAWNLPELLTDTIIYHHNPSAAKRNRQAVYQIYLANLLAHKLSGRAVEPDLEGLEIEEEVWSIVKASPEKITLWYNEIFERYDGALQLITIAEGEVD